MPLRVLLLSVYERAVCVSGVLSPLQNEPSSPPSEQSGTPLHSLLMWTHRSEPRHWCSLGGHRDTRLWGPEREKITKALR